MDVIARSLGEKIALKLGWSVVTQNGPGAGGNIGVDNVAKQPADGRTILITLICIAPNPR